MARINSKKKGAKGELELSNILKEFGFNTRRAQQFCGNTGEACDVIGLPNIHIECKRVENLNVDKAMEQAINDCSEYNAKNADRKEEERLPAVFHRKNNKGWLVTLCLENFIKIYTGEVQYEK